MRFIPTYNKALFVFAPLLLFLSFSLSNSFGASAAAELRFKPYSNSLIYISSQRERITKMYDDERVEKLSYTVKKKIEEKVEAVDEGILSRSFKQLAGSLKYMNKAKIRATANPEYSELIDSRGVELPFDESENPPAPDRIRLVFPENSLKQGDEWTYIAPATDVFPGELKTVYRLKKYKMYRNSLCAVIASRTFYSRQHSSQDVHVDIRSRGIIYFDTEKGIILNSVSSTTVKKTFLHPSDGLVQLTHVTDARYRFLK